jgi:TonB family protein
VRGDIGLQMYIESWRGKIERNASLNYPPSAKNKAHEHPIVTVAIRRDGSVEDVVIHQSSGMRDLDEAVRRIVQLYAPYSAFPPDLARRYDVIEIRRVWFFGDTLRIIEELR